MAKITWNELVESYNGDTGELIPVLAKGLRELFQSASPEVMGLFCAAVGIRPTIHYEPSLNPEESEPLPSYLEPL